MDRRVAFICAGAAVSVAAFPALAVDRDTVMSIAAGYATHIWTSTQKNVTATCSSSYRSDYSPGTHVGVCYDWGGYKTLAEFDAEIAAGQGAGSHSKDGVLACTTGVDCSGYVSKCWQESRYTTSTIDQISTKISSGDVKKGDIFNKAGSHVVLFSHFAKNGAPVFYEASGSASKVRLNTSGGWTFLKGYTARRYNGIEESAAPSCPAPAEITAFPFTDTRDTGVSACDQFNYYSCASKTNEGGPEYVYELTLARRGTLVVSVSSGPGVDIDIHLLRSLDPVSCSNRNDKRLSVMLDPGVYYLSADTYVGSSGTEYEGPFRLDVDFTPEGTVVPDGGTGDAGRPDAGTDGGGAPANGIARGVVYEEQGNGDMSKRIGGALVKVVETGATATAAQSDASWSFALAPGAYNIEASAAGFETERKPCEVLSGDTVWCSIGLTRPAPRYIDIASFPYTDSRNTNDSAHDLWDSYSCTPATGEKGPEFIYRFTVAEAGKVTATVTDGTGVDIDIHLLSAPDPTACLARNDTTVASDIVAGTYYLSADTYSNSGGTQYPGAYTLNVDFAAAGTGKGTPVGSMWNTYYYVSYEGDFTGAKDTNLYDTSCKVIATVPAKYSDTVCIEGTGKLSDGRVINYADTCSCGRPCPTGGTICYSVLDPATYPWGMGVQSRPLEPLRSWAVDKTFIAIGTILYAEEWDGANIPAADGIGGFVHDGCFVADDVGGAIKGNHYDFFAGTKSMWQALEAVFPTQSDFTVYKDPPRCSHLGP
jgi:3D (Asp-Asp-Asp) domain-containing protein